MSAFPVGSYVELSDEREAKVMRSNGLRQYRRPVVVPLNADGTESDEELDLTKTKSIQIVKALDESEI